jgi:hypothetical protein
MALKKVFGHLIVCRRAVGRQLGGTVQAGWCRRQDDSPFLGQTDDPSLSVVEVYASHDVTITHAWELSAEAFMPSLTWI